MNLAREMVCGVGQCVVYVTAPRCSTERQAAAAAAAVLCRTNGLIS